ncbi:MAG: flagellar motor stator protein MotA [Alphaproteobacteria bacterium]|nr:flagellar motor stator protein MotA [Alphaproteobacteria bacterium]
MYFISQIIVFASLMLGYMAMGGKLAILWQPFEFVIILGSGIGAFIGGNRVSFLKKILAQASDSALDKNLKKKEYLELLCVLYSIFKIARTKGMMTLEPHIEKPYESTVFKNYPTFLAQKESVDLVCDYIRVISMGVDDPMIIDDIIRDEVEGLQSKNEEKVASMHALSDSMPALGIVAAVLGVIKTMGSIDQPPEILGNLIGAALVGTFFGILMCYGTFSPLASRMSQVVHINNTYYDCIKAGIINYMHNLPPIIATEAARKKISHEYMPTYNEMEEVLNKIEI